MTNLIFTYGCDTDKTCKAPKNALYIRGTGAGGFCLSFSENLVPKNAQYVKQTKNSFIFYENISTSRFVDERELKKVGRIKKLN